MTIHSFIQRYLRAMLITLAGGFTMTAWSATLEVADALGRKVKVTTPVQHVALNFNFEELTAVAGKGNWARVVGISRAPWEGWRPVIFSRFAAVIPNLQAIPDIGHSDDGKLPGDWGPVKAEAVIADNPDLIFIAGSRWVNKPKAVKNGEVHAIEHGLCRTLVDFVAMPYIAKHLYPDAFKDVDPEAPARFCDVVALLQNGHLLASGTLAQVLTVAHVAQAFGVETEALRCGDGTGVLVSMRAMKNPLVTNNTIDSVASCKANTSATA